MQPGSGGGGAGGADPISAGAQAFNTLVKGINTARSFEFNKKVADENAMLSNEAGASEMAASDAGYRGAEGRQIAAVGASGFMAGTGSALDAVAQSRVMQTLSAMQISRQAQIRAMGYTEQAEINKFSARNAILTGATSAASGLLNTYADYANQSNASGYANSPVGALQLTPISNQGTGGNG